MWNAPTTPTERTPARFVEALFRPGEPWHTLLGMFAVGPLLVFTTLIIPHSSRFQGGVPLILALLGCAMGAWMAWRRQRLSDAEVLFFLTYATLAITACNLLCGSSASPYASLQLWPVIYAALYLRRGALLWITSLAVGGGILSVLATDDSGDGMIRLLSLTSTLLVTAFTLRRGSRQIQGLLGELAAQSHTDPLTGLMNRRAFDEQIARDVALSARGDLMFSLAMLDLDHLKTINDSQGHAAGDAALIRVADALRERLRSTDDAFRVGGDEFAVLLRGCAAEDAAMVLRDALLGLRAEDPPLTLSVGVATSPGHAQPRDLIRAADSALYAAKSSGRDRLCVLASQSRPVA